MPNVRECEPGTYFEPLVLKYALDGRILARGRQFCLEDNTERAIADDFTLCILQVPRLAGDAVLDLFADYLYTRT